MEAWERAALKMSALVFGNGMCLPDVIGQQQQQAAAAAAVSSKQQPHYHRITTKEYDFSVQYFRNPQADNTPTQPPHGCRPYMLPVVPNTRQQIDKESII